MRELAMSAASLKPNSPLIESGTIDSLGTRGVGKSRLDRPFDGSFDWFTGTGQPTGIPTKLSAVQVFLRFLHSRSIAVEAVIPEDITSYLESRLAEFQRKYKRRPSNVIQWRYRRT